MILQYQRLPFTWSYTVPSDECEIVHVEDEGSIMQTAPKYMVFSKAKFIAIVCKNSTVFSATLQDCMRDVFDNYTAALCDLLAIPRPVSEEVVKRLVIPDVIEIAGDKYSFEGNVLQCEYVPMTSSPFFKFRPYTRWYVNTNHVSTLLVCEDGAIMVYLDSATAVEKSLLRAGFDELTYAYSHDFDKWKTWEHKEESAEFTIRARAVLVL